MTTTLMSRTVEQITHKPQPAIHQRVPVAMKQSAAVVWLSGLIAVLALLAAGIGLFWQDGGAPFAFQTLRGEAVTIYGQGVYRYDTLFTGAANRGTDAVTLFLAIPLLVGATYLYRQGSLRGGLLLLGTLVWFLYVYASYALGTALNRLFLVYIALFSASLFAFVLAFSAFDPQGLMRHFSRHLPRRGPGVFMIAGGVVTAIIWLGPLLSALVQGQPPKLLGSYTTSITDVLDIGVITPSATIAGVLILRRAPLGYLITFSLLVLEVLLAPMIAAQTVSQLSAGISFTPAEIIGPIIGFVILAVLALWVLVVLLRSVSEASAGSAGATLELRGTTMKAETQPVSMGFARALGIGTATGVGIFLGISWLGLQVQPSPLPLYPGSTHMHDEADVPVDLPEPVRHFYHVIAGARVPVITSAVLTGRAHLRFAGITFPARFRFTHLAGQDYRHYIEATVFGRPVMKVNEWYLNGHSRLELPFGVVEHEPKVDMAANLGLWGESIWLPSIFLTDPRVRWEAIDGTTARLVVPFSEIEDRFTVRFDERTGLIKTMQALRYRDAKDERKIPWRLDPLGWQWFHGLRLPTPAAVRWLDQDSPWLVMTLEDVVYNTDVSKCIRASGA